MSAESPVCPRCESHSELEVKEQEGLDYFRCENCSHRWIITAWETITPASLRPAIKAIRESFERMSRNHCRRTERRCYAALHPSQEAGDSTQPGTPSSLFKWYVDLYGQAIDEAVTKQFRELIEIGETQGRILKMNPVDWAKSHILILISAEDQTVRRWIKDVCDHRETIIEEDFSTAEAFKEYLFWNNWQAPRYLHMAPSGNTPFSHETAWTREDAVRTAEVMNGLSRRFLNGREFHLSRIADAAHIEFAKLPHQSAASSNGVSPSPEPVHKPARRERHRLVDLRKELIARLKARHPRLKARQICEKIDRSVNGMQPIRRADYGPLDAWLKKAQGARLWVQCYDNSKTHDLVRAYVNKVPALKTTAKSLH